MVKKRAASNTPEQLEKVATGTTAPGKKNRAKNDHYDLRLYVTGSSEKSLQAITNVHALCEEYLPHRYHLEVVDVYQQPTRASAEQIVATPTLVRRGPGPAKRIVGHLSDRLRVLNGLELLPPSRSDTLATGTDGIDG